MSNTKRFLEREAATEAPMTQRYFFHLVNGADDILDPIGVDVDTPVQAHAEAVAVITEMKEAGDLPGDLPDWRLEIRTETGSLVLLIPLG